MVKIFTDDTSLFALFRDQHTSSDNLNRDLGRTYEWAIQWKMSFNPDPSKQAVEVYFSHKVDPVDATLFLLTKA